MLFQINNKIIQLLHATLQRYDQEYLDIWQHNLTSKYLRKQCMQNNVQTLLVQNTGTGLHMMNFKHSHFSKANNCLC